MSTIQRLNDEEIETFRIDSSIKDIFIATIVTNHNNNTMGLPLLGTHDIKNSYTIENLNPMLNSNKMER